MTRTALDTSVIVAAHMSWHADHARATAAILSSFGPNKRVVVPIPALIQSYSVMTRMPVGQRVRPQEARDALRASLTDDVDLVAHDGAACWDLLDAAVAKGVAGGGIHDADILACAERAGAKRLLTLNPTDFERLGPTSVEIVVP